MQKTVAAVNHKTAAATDSDNRSSLRGAIASIVSCSSSIRQVVLVTATSWTSDEGSLHLFAKAADRWRLEERHIPVMRQKRAGVGKWHPSYNWRSTSKSGRRFQGTGGDISIWHRVWL